MFELLASSGRSLSFKWMKWMAKYDIMNAKDELEIMRKNIVRLDVYRCNPKHISKFIKAPTNKQHFML
jgi:hypothetical protein